jgi:hypothetical protein
MACRSSLHLAIGASYAIFDVYTSFPFRFRLFFLFDISLGWHVVLFFPLPLRQKHHKTSLSVRFFVQYLLTSAWLPQGLTDFCDIWDTLFVSTFSPHSFCKSFFLLAIDHLMLGLIPCLHTFLLRNGQIAIPKTLGWRISVVLPLLSFPFALLCSFASPLLLRVPQFHLCPSID